MKHHILSIAVAAALLGGAAGGPALANPAATPQPQRAAAAAPEHGTDAETNDGPREAKGGAEGAQSAKLAPFAKISAAAAQRSAVQRYGGTAGRTQLEREKGRVVYSVIVGAKDVKVDAVTGRVLSAESALEKSDGDGEDPKR